MRIDRLFRSVVGACLFFSSPVMANVLLNGRNTTPEMIVRVAKGEAVAVDAKAWTRSSEHMPCFCRARRKGRRSTD